MAEATAEKTACENCGAEIREGTLFCYNCGNKFDDALPASNGTAISDEARNALDDLAARLELETESENKLALAAAERKKARVTPKKKKEVVWDADEDRSGLLFFFVSLFIFILVMVVVFIAVYWK